jgi:hypothetical protein
MTVTFPRLVPATTPAGTQDVTSTTGNSTIMPIAFTVAFAGS